MARFRFDFGAEFDMLTQPELDRSLGRIEQMWRSYAVGRKPFALPVMRGKVAGGVLQLGSSSDPGQVSCGPRSGWAWRVTRISVAGLSSTTGDNTSGVSASFTAGNAGTATLPGLYRLWGFDITTGAPAAPPVAATVTVSNVSGGPYTYTLMETANGGLLQVRFPIPLASTGTAPAVSVAAAAGGAAGQINAFGSFLGLQANAPVYDQVTVYKGDPDLSKYVTTLGTQSPSWTGSQGCLLLPGDHIVVAGTGLAAANLTVTGEAVEAPAEMIYKLVGG